MNTQFIYNRYTKVLKTKQFQKLNKIYNKTIVNLT